MYDLALGNSCLKGLRAEIDCDPNQITRKVTQGHEVIESVLPTQGQFKASMREDSILCE